MMAQKDKVVDGQHRRRRLPLQEKQGRLDQGQGAHRRARPGRGRAERRRPAAGEDPPYPDRHRLRAHAAAGHRHRREAHRLLHRRPLLAGGAEASGRHRRRLYRPRDGLGLAAPRQRGDGRRIPRPHPAGHGWRGVEGDGAPAAEAGHRLQARDQGDGGGAERRPASI